MSTLGKRIAMLAVAAMFVAGVATEVMGAATDWKSTAGTGYWGNDSNWTDGAPGDKTHADAMINQSDADVTLDGTGTDVSGNVGFRDGTWKMDEGTLTVDYSGNYLWTDNDVKLSTAGKDATLNIENGTVKAGSSSKQTWYLGHNDSDSSMTVNMYGGTLAGGDYYVGEGNGTGTFNLYGGTVQVNELENTTRGNFKVGHDSGTGTLNVYGTQSNFDIDERLWIGDDGGTGTYKAWLDGSETNTVSGTDQQLLLNQGKSSNLEVGLPGGVMQSSTDSFTLIDLGGDLNNDPSTTEKWDSTPDNLWSTTTTSDSKVSVTLDSDFKGSLNPSNIGETTPMGSSIYGFIEWDNQENATATELLLDFAWSNTDSGKDTVWDTFIEDLGDAGYTVLDQNFDETNPWAQLELDLAGEATEYFTWDLSEYHGSPQLQVNGMEVVPEPSSLLLLGLASLLLMKPRRRRA